MLDVTKLSRAYRVRRMTSEDAQDILSFCLQNTQYYRYCGKQPTLELVQSDLCITPPGKSAADKYYVGFWDGDTMVAVMDLIEGYPDDETCFVGFFMVNKGLQGRHIGSGIVQEVFGYLGAAGYDRVMLGVDKGNPQSTAFWTKNGFVVVKEVAQEGGTIMVAARDL